MRGTRPWDVSISSKLSKIRGCTPWLTRLTWPRIRLPRASMEPSGAVTSSANDALKPCPWRAVLVSRRWPRRTSMVVPSGIAFARIGADGVSAARTPIPKTSVATQTDAERRLFTHHLESDDIAARFIGWRAGQKRCLRKIEGWELEAKKRLRAEASGSAVTEFIDLVIDFLPQIIPDLIGHGKKELHNNGIELAPGIFLNLGFCGLQSL